MAEAASRGRAAVKFGFWTLLSVGLFAYVISQHSNGTLSAWYYHRAAADGYAVDADSFRDATKDHPAVLTVAKVDRIEGLVAVPVRKGDLLPARANGILGDDVIREGKRATLEGANLKVTVPWQIQQAKGFKFKDTFKHKGIETWPWAAAWNVVIVLGLGVSLGFMAEGFTDLIGVRVERIRHFEGH